MGGKTEIEEKVIQYVYKHYPSYNNKLLTVKEYDSHFAILKHPTGGPLILSKGII